MISGEFKQVPCSSCGKTDRVTIGSRKYCANCGAVVTGEDAPTAAVPSAKPAAMTDIRPPSTDANLAPSIPTPPPVPQVPVPPPAPAPMATPTPAAAAQVSINPSNQFHAAPVGSDRAVVPTPSVTPAKPLISVTPGVPAPSPTVTPVQVPIVRDAAKQSERLAKAGNVAKSEAINKFTAPPAPAAAPPEPEPAPSPIITPVTPSLAPATPPPAPAPTTVPAVTPVALPNAAISQIDNLQKLVPQAPPAPAGIGQALKPSSVAAAAVALAIMGGYIWVHNYPNMALKMASAKAGIDASLPKYVPPSFSLAGPVSYSPGQITLKFNSGAGQALTLSQTKTDWDPRSLLENFVSQKTDKYLAVQNHGLTVYMYNGNQASWINRGIWYTIEGTNQLNREQILKIVDSL